MPEAETFEKVASVHPRCVSGIFRGEQTLRLYFAPLLQISLSTEERRGPVVCQTTAVLLTAQAWRCHEPDGQHGPTWCLGGLNLPEVQPLMRGCLTSLTAQLLNSHALRPTSSAQHAMFHALLAQL